MAQLELEVLEVAVLMIQVELAEMLGVIVQLRDMLEALVKAAALIPAEAVVALQKLVIPIVLDTAEMELVIV